MTTNIQKNQSSRLVSGSPIFYGWVIWFVGTIGLIATSPGQSYSVSLFIDHFIADFGIDRTTVSAFYGIGTFIGSLALIWVGKQIDFHGNRFVGIIVSILFALVLILFSLVATPLLLLPAFLSIRLLGQGSLSLVHSTAIANWFQNRRGRVMSFSLVALAIFQSFYVPWLQEQIEIHGWRYMWVVLGVGVAATILPLTIFLMKNHPEQYGLLPDGKPNKAKDDFTVEPFEDNWTLPEARRTLIFWVFLVGRFMPSAWGTGLIFHQISIFENLGHDASVAAQTFGSMALSTAVIALAAGYMLDHFRPNYIMIIQMLALVSINILAIFMQSPILLLVYAISFAFAMGTGSVFDGTVWVNLFGRLYQGSIRGFVMMGGVIGSAIGPILFGFSFDNFGSYTPILWLGAGLSMIPLIFSIFVKKPGRKVESA